MSFFQLRSPRVQNSLDNTALLGDSNVNVSDTTTLTESVTVVILPPDLGVIVTPGIQQITGLKVWS